MPNTVNRFDKTIENYDAFRPTYPHEAIQILIQHHGLTQDSIIADIGAGTGKLTELLLQNGNQVFAIEPNTGMRQVAENKFQSNPLFHSKQGDAEATGLANQQVDFITAGQAFHWFKPTEARQEFKRVLKPDGWVMLIWNFRDKMSTPFMQAYEELILKYGTDYKEVAADTFDTNKVQQFFAPKIAEHYIFNHIQEADWVGCKGRLDSTSYTPKPGDLHYEAMINELEGLYKKFSQNEKVSFVYRTEMYVGHL